MKLLDGPGRVLVSGVSGRTAGLDRCCNLLIGQLINYPIMIKLLISRKITLKDSTVFGGRCGTLD